MLKAKRTYILIIGMIAGLLLAGVDEVNYTQAATTKGVTKAAYVECVVLMTRDSEKSSKIQNSL